jgi:hypothetical protein
MCTANATCTMHLHLQQQTSTPPVITLHSTQLLLHVQGPTTHPTVTADLVNATLTSFPVKPDHISDVDGPYLELSKVDDSTLDVKVVHTFKAHFNTQPSQAAATITQQPSYEADGGAITTAAAAAGLLPQGASPLKRLGSSAAIVTEQPTTEESIPPAAPPSVGEAADAMEHQLLLDASNLEQDALMQRISVLETTLATLGNDAAPSAAHGHGPTMLMPALGPVALPFAAAVASPFAVAADMPPFSVESTGAPSCAAAVVDAETGKQLPAAPVAGPAPPALLGPNATCIVEECDETHQHRQEEQQQQQLVPLAAQPSAAGDAAHGMWRQPSIGVPLASSFLQNQSRPRGEWELDPGKIIVGRRLAVGGFGEVGRCRGCCCCTCCTCCTCCLHSMSLMLKLTKVLQMLSIP